VLPPVGVGLRRNRRARRRSATVVVVLLLSLVAPLAGTTPARAAGLPRGFSASVLVSGLINPTALAVAPDGRVFICTQVGAVRVVKQGKLLSTAFLKLTVDANGERGLLGIAFDPNFASNHYIYLYYTSKTPVTHNRVSRFTANGDVVAPGSETVIFDLDPLSSSTHHNGGAIHFGADGKLYIAVGENENGANAQSFANRLGKLLRISKNGTIPSDNPFYASASGKNRAIWALGLRNPFSFDVQRGTGRIFINDAGENSWEEINDGLAGANYGWPIHEGSDGGDPAFHDPFFTYGHGTTSATGCVITAGVFYNPPTAQFPRAYVGDYLYADLCGGWIRRLDPATRQTVAFATGIAKPVALAVGNDGALYYLSRGTGTTTGRLQRITYSGS
jgi:glucose/arabinose dehydrogenase